MIPLFFLIFGIILFSTQGIFIKLADVGSIPEISLNFYKVLFAFIIFLIISPFIDKNTFKTSQKDMKEYAVVGFFVFLTSFLFTMAVVKSTVSNATLITYLYPFFTMVFGYFLLKESITKTKIIVFIVALSGLFLINPLSNSNYITGNILAFLNAIVYGLVIVLMKLEDNKHHIGSFVWIFLFATIFMLPFPLIFGFGTFDLTSTIYLFLLGAVSMGLAYLLINLGLKKVESYFASIIDLTFSPLISIGLAVIVIREEISTQVILGGLILIFCALYLEKHKKEYNNEISSHSNIKP